MNSFHMMLDIRENIGERFNNEKHWLDADILRKMNSAEKKIAGMMAQGTGDWWVTSTTLTPSSSKITLPSDCVKPVALEVASDGTPIPINQMTIRERYVGKSIGSSLSYGSLEAYFEDLYLVVNSSSFTDNVTLWYEKRIPDMSWGVISTGAASSLAMDAGQHPSLSNDYYNGVVVETMGTTNYEIKISSTVSDYVGSTMTMTVTGTPTTSDYYGTISLLPQEAHRLLVLNATIALLAKPSSAIDPKYFEYWRDELRREENGFRIWLSGRAGTTGRVRTTGDD